MKKTPKAGDLVEIQRHDDGSPRWVTACVEQSLAAQFTYDFEIDGKNVHDFMLYNSTEWRFPK